jgi:hypothetical protein
MKKIVLMLLLCFPLLGTSQDKDSINETQKKLQDKILLHWLADLSKKGIEKSGDSVITSKEFKRVLKDIKYRELLYPKEYTWEVALSLMNSKYLKQTFWYFINLYPENESNKQLIVNSILAYDKYLKMDEMMINTFYTYSFMDPEISVIKEGEPEIIRPDILEQKLSYVKEMVSYVRYYRKQNQVAEAGKN